MGRELEPDRPARVLLRSGAGRELRTPVPPLLLPPAARPLLPPPHRTVIVSDTMRRSGRIITPSRVLVDFQTTDGFGEAGEIAKPKENRRFPCSDCDFVAKHLSALGK